MSRLLHFADGRNGQLGLGATIRLDSGEPCVVSCAQSGVRVKHSRFGFFGSTLYEEKNVYRIAKTASALAYLFPVSKLPDGFHCSVLSALANAILHCANCTEVALALNEAESRREQTESWDVDAIASFATLMAEGKFKPDAFYDVNVLPHPKHLLLQAIERQLGSEDDNARAEWLKIGALFLPSFQEEVGADPIFWAGLDISQLSRTVEGLKAALNKIGNYQSDAQNRLAVMKAEKDRITAQLSAVISSRAKLFAQVT